MIIIFKTNVENSDQVNMLKPQLDIYVKESKWNFDLEDCDKILRVDSHDQITETIVDLLESNGFFCEEFPY